MTQASDLYTFRAVRNGQEPKNAVSRYRAVNLMLNWAAKNVPVTDMHVEQLVKGKWERDLAADEQFKARQPKFTPRVKKSAVGKPKVSTLQSSLKDLKAVVTAVLARPEIDEASMNALKGTVYEVARLLKAHREMEAHDAEPKEVTEARDKVTELLGKGTQK
jgi:hypothetical protein